MIGVLNKIKSQLISLEGLFDELSFLSLSKDKIVLSILKNGQFHESKILNTATKENDFSVFWTASKCLISKNYYHMVYFRYDLSNQVHQFIDFIKSTEKLTSIFCCEIPTYPFYNELNERKNVQFEKNVVQKVSTLCDHIFTPSCINKINGRKVFHFENSYNISKLYKFSKRTENNKFRLLIIANASSWHGIERILHGAQKHKESNLEIDIFGNGNQTERLRSLVVELNLDSVVKFHESKNLSFFETNRKNWNMGVSSLGLHRIKCRNAKPIKARDYVALGLPIICTIEDKSMAKNGFNLIVSSNESSVNLNSVISHYNKLDEKQTQNEMFMFSKSYLNWNSFRDKIQEATNNSDRLSYTEST